MHRCELIAAALVLATALPGDDLHGQSVANQVNAAGNRGTLLIHGGGGTSDEVRETFLALAGGKAARIVVIPTASQWADSEDAEVRDGYALPWKSLGAADVQILHTRSRDQANAAAFIEPLKQATAVWLGGGDQSRIAEAYLGTAVERELMALLARGGVIGGTSAGAAIQSRTMIAGGQSEPLMGVGFDLLPLAIIDQHFLARERQARLRRAVADHPDHVGLGIDEHTALIVQGRRLTVIGDSSVSVLLAAAPTRPAQEFELRAGDCFDLGQIWQEAVERSQPRPAATTRLFRRVCLHRAFATPRTRCDHTRRNYR